MKPQTLSLNQHLQTAIDEARTIVEQYGEFSSVAIAARDIGEELEMVVEPDMI